MDRKDIKVKSKYFTHRMYRRCVSKGVDIDGRTAVGKSLAKLEGWLVSHVGGNPTVPQQILISRIKFKILYITDMEKRILSGEVALTTFYIALANSLRHDLQALGLERQEKDITTWKDFVTEEEERV